MTEVAERITRAAQISQALALVEPYFDALAAELKEGVFKLPISGQEREVERLRIGVQMIEHVKGRLKATIQDGEVARHQNADHARAVEMTPEQRRWAERLNG